MKKLLVGLLTLGTLSAIALPSITTQNPDNIVTVKISGNTLEECSSMFNITNKQLQTSKKVIVLSQTCYSKFGEVKYNASLKYLKY
ncbi:MAG: hypothetical protein N4A33_08510 [Bacteriovoracaceae bacterium]|jgi:hypothetical protein|nr:hypothetical protein [Bacteriovoracaceae bacterium]